MLGSKLFSFINMLQNSGGRGYVTLLVGSQLPIVMLSPMCNISVFKDTTAQIRGISKEIPWWLSFKHFCHLSFDVIRG